MTNKEALEALLEGKKITTQLWLENSKIKTCDKTAMPKYIYFDFDKDEIISEVGRPVYFDTRRIKNTGCEYMIYEESLLTEDEKQFVSKIADAMDYPYECIEFIVIDGYIVIRANEKDCIAIALKDLAYKFEGLETDKDYTLEELGINGDD